MADIMRPLKRPKLGIPDVYPQETRQKEDELTVQTLTHGLRPVAIHSYETGSAKNDLQHMRINDFTSRLNQISDVKKRTSWGHDSQKKRLNLSRDNFWPVPMGRSKKEQAAVWFQGLAGNESLEQLIKKKVPIFNKREEIFDVLFEKSVPISRAVWYIKVTAVYSSLGAEMKLNKKKQSSDPSFEWTVSLTKFMQETVWRLSNDTHRHDSLSGTRSSVSQQNEETELELSRWKYITELSSWLYQENLLDCQEFLRWLIERIETSKPDEKSLVLYLPLALKYLLDISGCVYLARPLIQFCCHKFASLYDAHSKVLQSLPPRGTKRDHETMETNEDDDVFSSGVPPTGHHTIKQEHKTSKCQAEDEPQTHRLPSTRKRTKSGSLTVTIESSNFSGLNEAGGTGGTPGLVGSEEEGAGCKHHSSLLLQLSCIIQVVAVQCPTAFINVSLTGKGGREYIPKAATPLDKLPLRLSAMPLPKKMTEKKLESILSLTEHDIRQRTNVADSGWSAMAVPDLQTSNKGRIVMEVLKVLKVLDGHSFTTCKYHSPLSTLYVKIYQVYKNTESFFQSTDSLCMLLCQWAVTPHRTGIHRPLVSARLLKRIQHDKLQGQVLTDLDALDEYWEYPETGFYGDIATFPFQQILFQFLDTRASLPESLYFPLKNNESFKHLLTLFADLIHLHVFSYSLYLSTLIARGDTRSPVIPLLPFFKGESGNPPLLIDSEVKELNLSIPLSLIPNFLKAKRPTTLDTIVQGSSEGTISPRLPSAFGSQDNLLETLGSFGTPSFGQEEHMKMETSTLFMPSEELMMDPLEEGPSQLVSPVGFGSHASSPIKQDVFDFSLNFLDEPPSSNHSMEDISLQPTSTTAATTTSAVPTTTLDPVTHKHLIYATYFPLSPADISGQDLTQRSVVLCGTGQSRAKVNQVVDELRNRSHDLILALSAVHSPVFNQATVEFLSEFKLLPTFEQNFIACNCVQTILSVTISNKTFPSCSQVLLACEMLELSGSHYKLVQFLIELITCEEERERKEARQHSIPIPLPSILCIPVINILWNYLSILLLSSHDTLVVYERLYRVLDNNIAQPTKYTTAQKAVFLFLKHLQTHCYYVERTYSGLPNLFDMYCTPRVEDMSLQTNNILPDSIKRCRETSVFAGGNPTDSEHAINQVISFIRSTPKNSFYFVCEVFQLAMQKKTDLNTLTILAHVSSEVSSCVAILPSELLGALRAICIPNTIYKACVTGYMQLTQKNNILSSSSIHGNLVTFIGLLLSFNCFTIQDIIVYIVKPIFKVYLLHPQESANASKGTLSLKFVNLLLRHLLVEEYVRNEITPDAKADSSICYPPFVRHFLLAKSRQLSFDMLLNLLKDLLKLCKDTLRSSRGTTWGGNKTGMSIIVESYPSGSEGNEAALVKLRETMELIAKQDWVREKCSKQDSRQLLDPDKLGDASLSPPQAQYLLYLLIPYQTPDTVNQDINGLDGSLPSYMTHPDQTIDRILKNLDQWTLHNALLHLNLNINHNSMQQVDHLSQSVIQVFEDYCNGDWPGNTDDKDLVDGAFSPSIWLVTPLVSELPKSVLGRILKSAGNVLGRGQWWNQDRSQEKRRSTRTANNMPPPSTPASSYRSGLQWQQPFLELVFVCMSYQSNHEELLGPLQKQLSTFLAFFEKEGAPLEEQNRSLLYTALRLRLNLVGSMLGSVCVSENNILEWVSLLTQLICSGAVDRQPDNNDLFTNCLDMLSALLQTLSPDFHISIVSGGEEGKKSYIQCIKKMKADLSVSKSCCKQEIQQLFPLQQKYYDVTIVKPPSFTQQFSRPSEKIQGLRVQENKEISPWEIIEGVKGCGPFQLSWFGAMRMKRKPLTYFEQHKRVFPHTHQQEYFKMTSQRHYVYLPEVQPEAISTDTNQSIPVSADNLLQPNTSRPNQLQGNEQKRILDTIREMNKKSDIFHPPGPLPTNMMSPSIGPGVMPPAVAAPRPQAPHTGHVMGTRPMIGNPAANMLAQLLREMPPEERNYYSTLPQDQKRIYLMNYQRRRQVPVQMDPSMYRPQVHHGPGVMMRSMPVPQRYPQMMGPPGHPHHPGAGYMMPPHHPQGMTPMFRPMYGQPHMRSMHYPHAQ